MDEATIVVGGSVSAVAAADFDGDLLTDLAVAREDDGIVGFLRGRPGARFASEVPISVGTGPSALTTGDWNGDGVDDAAVARQRGDEAGRVEILLGGPDGLAAAGGLLAGLTPVDVAAGDFDADGNMDLVVANNVSADVTILRGGGDGNFSPAGTLSVGGAARAVDVADFDLDGCDDFVVGLSMDGLVVPYFGACNATFARGPQTLSGALSPAGLVAEDFTGDGIADVAMGDEVNNMVIFFTKRANDRFFLNFPGDDYTVSRRPVHMRAGDFDGDGRYEAITLNSFVAGSISVLTSIVGDGGLRGDANDDAVVSAADLAGVLLEVGDGDGNRVVESINAYPGGPSADANGDAVISRQDVRAVAARIFPRS